MKKIRLSTVSQVYEAFLHSRKALGAKEVILRTYCTSFLPSKSERSERRRQ